MKTRKAKSVIMECVTTNVTSRKPDANLNDTVT